MKKMAVFLFLMHASGFVRAGSWDSSTSSVATSTSADSVAGGSAGNILYQSGPSATGFVTNGTTGQVLTSNGSSAPTWSTSSGGGDSVYPATSTAYFPLGLNASDNVLGVQRTTTDLLTVTNFLSIGGVSPLTRLGGIDILDSHGVNIEVQANSYRGASIGLSPYGTDGAFRIYMTAGGFVPEIPSQPWQRYFAIASDDATENSVFLSTYMPAVFERGVDTGDFGVLFPDGSTQTAASFGSVTDNATPLFCSQLNAGVAESSDGEVDVWSASSADAAGSFNTYGIYFQTVDGNPASSLVGSSLGTDGGYVSLSTTGATLVADPSQAFLFSTGPVSAEMLVMDGAGNVTQISPHDQITGRWVYNSVNVNTGKRIVVDMEKAISLLEKLSGEKIMQVSYDTGLAKASSKARKDKMRRDRKKGAKKHRRNRKHS